MTSKPDNRSISERPQDLDEAVAPVRGIRNMGKQKSAVKETYGSEEDSDKIPEELFDDIGQDNKYFTGVNT